MTLYRYTVTATITGECDADDEAQALIAAVVDARAKCQDDRATFLGTTWDPEVKVIAG